MLRDHHRGGPRHQEMTQASSRHAIVCKDLGLQFEKVIEIGQAAAAYVNDRACARPYMASAQGGGPSCRDGHG